MRKIIVSAEKSGVKISGTTGEIDFHLSNDGWINHHGKYSKEGATVEDAEHVLLTYFDKPTQVKHYTEKSVSVRQDTYGNTTVEGATELTGNTLRTNGGTLTFESQDFCRWTFAHTNLETVKTLIDKLTEDPLFDVKVIEMTWNTTYSPFSLDSTAFPTQTNPEPRLFTEKIPEETLKKYVVCKQDGKIIDAFGIPLEQRPELANFECELCGTIGHSKELCICPFCHYIGWHDPRECYLGKSR